MFLCCAHLAQGQRLQLGGNFNEHAETIRWELLEASNTRLIRGFIPASPFLSDRRDLSTDPAVQNLKKAALDGYKVILCVKWDFKRADWRVPLPHSKEEGACFDWVAALLGEIGPVAALETVNEVMVDTQDADIVPDADGAIPFVQFQQRLVDYLESRLKALPPIYMGGFTRMDKPIMQEHPLVRQMIDWIQADERISGANFHIHATDMEIFGQALAYMRSQIPAKPLIVTEFSLVWKYKRALKHPIGRFAKGREFASAHGYDPDLSVRQFINYAIDEPLPQPLWQAFLHSQYWYEPDFLEQACGLMNRYKIKYAAYAFQQGSSGPGKLGPDSNPWILNPLYLPLTTIGEVGRAAMNKDFMQAYQNWR
jgi:hypothetical protein